MPTTKQAPNGLPAANEKLLDAAEELFYERGYQAVGMDQLRDASGMPLKRIYSLYPGKEALAVAMLNRRDHRWHTELTEYVERHASQSDPVIAAFDWLAIWLSGPGHRGCAWANAYGELGGTSAAVADAARRHKATFRDYLTGLVTDAGGSSTTADAAYLLAEGCMVTAGITGSVDVVSRAQQVLRRLLE